MIKFKVLPINVRCLFESESRNHVYLRINQSGGLYDNGRNLQVTLSAKAFWISIVMWNLNVQSAKNFEPVVILFRMLYATYYLTNVQ